MKTNHRPEFHDHKLEGSICTLLNLHDVEAFLEKE